jgi:hypothetical protein
MTMGATSPPIKSRSHTIVVWSLFLLVSCIAFMYVFDDELRRSLVSHRVISPIFSDLNSIEWLWISLAISSVSIGCIFLRTILLVADKSNLLVSFTNRQSIVTETHKATIDSPASIFSRLFQPSPQVSRLYQFGQMGAETTSADFIPQAPQ